MNSLLKYWFFFIFFSSVSLARAEEELIVEKTDYPLIIKGIFDDKTAITLSGTVRITLKAGDVNTKIYAVGDNLIDGDVTIFRDNISIPAISLTKDQPQDIKITINNINQIGNFTGNLRIWTQSEGYDKALLIPIKLNIAEKIQVKPLNENISYQITRCDWSFDCFLAKLVLPESETDNQWQVGLNNLTKQTEVKVTEANLAIMNDSAILPPQVTNPNQILTTDLNSIPVKFVSDYIPPNSYKGHLRFSVAGLDDPVIIQTNLSVRDGPFLALVTILVGILVGRMARDMESPIAQKQTSLLPRWYKLQYDGFYKIFGQSVQQSLRKDLLGARESIDSSYDTIEVASKRLDELAFKVDFFLDLQTIEDDLPDDLQKDHFIELIDNCRKQMLAGKIEDANNSKKAIFLEIVNLRSDGTMGMREDVKAAIARISSFTDESMSNAKNVLDKAIKFQNSLLRRSMVGLSGAYVTAETRYWIFRPLISLLILVLLMLLGLQTLYVKSGSTFGSGGLYDYLGLFLWGISADVAQRTLFNLPQSK